MGTAANDPRPDDCTPEHPLDPKQLRALNALLAGNTRTDAAKVAGVSRDSVHRWLKEPEFQAHLNRRMWERQERFDRRQSQLDQKALDVIEKGLDCGDQEVAFRYAEDSHMFGRERPAAGLTDPTSIRMARLLRQFHKDDLAHEIHNWVGLRKVAGHLRDVEVLGLLELLVAEGRPDAAVNVQDAEDAREFWPTTDEEKATAVRRMFAEIEPKLAEILETDEDSHKDVED